MLIVGQGDRHAHNANHALASLHLNTLQSNILGAAILYMPEALATQWSGGTSLGLCTLSKQNHQATGERLSVVTSD